MQAREGEGPPWPLVGVAAAAAPESRGRLLTAGDEYERQTNMALLRANLRKNDFVVRPKQMGKQHAGGMERGFLPDPN